MRRTILFVFAVFAITATAKNPNYDDSRYKIVGVFEKGKRTQVLRSAFTLDAFREVIKAQWRKGYDLKEVKYADSKWIGLFEPERKGSHQTYLIVDRWITIDDEIDAYWKKGYDIVNIEHGLAHWLVILEKNTGYKAQSYERRDKREDFVAAVKKRWKAGYDLIDFEYGEGHYTGIFAKPTGYLDEAIAQRSRWHRMKEAIVTYWRKGYRIGNVEFMLGRWFAYFVKRTDMPRERYVSAEHFDDFYTRFERLRKEGFVLRDLAEGW